MSKINSAETVIVGLGITGFSCAEYLIKQKVPFIILDSRLHPPQLETFKQQFPSIPVYTGEFSAEILSQAKRIILSPGFSKQDPSLTPYLSPKVDIIGDIELFAKATNTPVVAITGSNGKSTVTTLLGEMLKESGVSVGVGGNLGQPALSLLDENKDMYVLELSSFQLETTYSLKPKIATILNLCYDHMDRYHSLEEYYEAKSRIFAQCENMVVNRDDAYLLERIPKNKPQISFGLTLPKNETEFGVSFEEGVLKQGKQAIFKLSDLKLFGRHNVANALAALSLGTILKLPLGAMQSVLRTFPGLPHRCEWVRTLNSVQWINDSKGTNVGATEAALQGLEDAIPGKWVLIAGGLGKNADFTPLKAIVEKTCRAVILLGEAKEELNTLLSQTTPCFKANTLEEAVQLAKQQAKPGDGVLLSPACASFDMFNNFEHRGEVFKAAVLDLT